MEALQNNNYKGYRFITTQYSPSHIFNNISSCDGESFVYLS